MALLTRLGPGLNSTTLEGTTVTGSGSIDSSIVRNGIQSFKTAAAGSAANFKYQFKTSNTNARFFYRAYFRIGTLPGAEDKIFWADRTQTDGLIGLRLETNGTLQLWNEALATPAQIGSASPALSTNTWYRLELDIDSTTAASTVVTAYIDGVSFASGTVDTSNHGGSQAGFGWGSRNNVTATYNFADLGVNDTSGAAQTGLLGASQITYLHPNAAGDNTQLTIGGSSPAATNWQSVSEVTPDDGVTFVASNTLNQTDDYNIDNTPSSIGTNDTINAVAVGIRLGGAGASANATLVLRIKKASGGTVSESGSLQIGGTAYKTNMVVTPPANYSHILYTDPDGLPWTKASLDLTQIGERISVTNTNNTQISAIWLIIDSTPAALTAPSAPGNPFHPGRGVLNMARFHPSQQQGVILGHSYTQILTDTLTLTSTVVKTPKKVLSDSVTLTSSVVKKWLHVLSDSITLTSSVTKIKTQFRTFTDTITFISTVLKNPRKVLSDSTTFASTIARKTTKTLSDTVTLTSTIKRTITAVRSEVITLTSSVFKKTTKVLSTAISFSENFQASRVRMKSVTDTITFIETLTKKFIVVRTFTDRLVFFEIVWIKFTRAGATYIKQVATSAAYTILNAASAVWNKFNPTTTTHTKQNPTSTTWKQRNQTNN